VTDTVRLDTELTDAISRDSVYHEAMLTPRASLVLVLLSGLTSAQWSADAAANQFLSDQDGEQTQAKIVATGDGGFYVSWFDSDPGGSPAFGYDVYLQRLDERGEPQWAEDGVVIADRGFSSTTDYDLELASDGSALLTFRDDRFAGTQITATKVDTAGAQTWGATGVQLTNTGAFVASPKIARTSTGGAIVAWVQDSTTHVQGLDASGATVWGPTVLAPPAGAVSPSDMHGSEGGGAILLLAVDTGGFGAPRNLYAQKFNELGAPQWGAGPVAIFDSGSLQFGNFPTFVTDGAGGAVIGWYSSSPSLECFVQRVDSSGTELFAHNGVAASTNAAQLRVSPSVAFDATTGETYLFYSELNGAQSMSGVSGQKFDAAGARQWTNSGLTLQALSSNNTSFVASVATGSGAAVGWIDSVGFGQDQIVGARVSSAGALVGGLKTLSSPASGKGRQVAARGSDYTAFVWRDEREGTPDILAQNLWDNGQLGGVAASAVRNGSGSNALCLTSSDDPVLGTTWDAEVDTTGVAIPSFSGILFYPAPLPGVPVAGGELLVDVTKPLLFLSTAVAGVSPDAHAVPIPDDATLAGFTIYTQGVVAGTSTQFCNAIDLTLGL